MNKVLLYTSIFGAYDTLEEVSPQTISHDTRCYTDQDFESVTWQVAKRRLSFGADTMLTSRYYKIAPAISEYQFCVYLDGSFQIASSRFLEFILGCLGENNFVFFKHPWRDCIYDEAAVCLTVPKYNHERIRMQIDKYERAGIPRHYSLWACGCFAFRNDRKSLRFRKAWWRELRRTATMDQISLPYIVNKRRFEKYLNTIDQDIYQNEYIKYVGHKREYVAQQGRQGGYRSSFVKWLQLGKQFRR